MVRKIVLVMALSALLTACSSSREDLKSPCVGTDESPCGPKRAINHA
jgi:major membrane immunogen (membrane-anchored lipoprotein)